MMIKTIRKTLSKLEASFVVFRCIILGRYKDGHVTSYRLIIGSAAARRCGFVLENGERVELEVTEKPEEKAIIT